MTEPSYPIRKLQQTKRRDYVQYFLVLPPSIVKSLDWQKGEEIEIILDDGDIRLHRKEAPADD